MVGPSTQTRTAAELREEARKQFRRARYYVRAAQRYPYMRENLIASAKVYQRTARDLTRRARELEAQS